MKNNKKLLISLTAIFSVFVIIAVFLMIWFWGDRYGDFRELKQEFDIPDLEGGGSPQGLANYFNGEYEVKTEFLFHILLHAQKTALARVRCRTGNGLHRLCYP